MSKLKSVKRTIEWKIDGFNKEFVTKYKPETISCIFSPEFVILLDSNKTKWRIKINPNGRKPEDANNVSLFISVVDSTSRNFSYHITSSIMSEDGVPINSRHYTKLVPNLKVGISCGNSQFISHKDLFDRANELLAGDKLRLQFDLELTEVETLKVAKEEVSFADCNKRLLDEGLFSDFVFFTSDDKEIRVHKNMIAIRSSVFEKMLLINMRESRENKATFDDIDYNTMMAFLRYLYYECIDRVHEIAVDLLKVAHKYDVAALKNICLDSLAKSLKVENAVELLLLSDLYNFDKLRNASIFFIANHFHAVKITSKWNDLKNNSDLLEEIIEACIAKITLN